MKTTLPAAIGTLEEAKTFLKALYDNVEAFHPEDDAFDINWGCDPVPTEDECQQLNKLMEDIYTVAKDTDFDPCGFLLHLDPDYKME